MMPVHMWVVVWLIAAKLHSDHPGHFRPYPLRLLTSAMTSLCSVRAPAVPRREIYVVYDMRKTLAAWLVADYSFRRKTTDGTKHTGDA